MKVTIDIHPSMIGSPQEIGELVERQIEAEASGQKRVTVEEGMRFVEGVGLVGEIEKPERLKNITNKNTLINYLCRR